MAALEVGMFKFFFLLPFSPLPERQCRVVNMCTGYQATTVSLNLDLRLPSHFT